MWIAREHDEEVFIVLARNHCPSMRRGKSAIPLFWTARPLRVSTRKSRKSRVFIRRLFRSTLLARARNYGAHQLWRRARGTQDANQETILERRNRSAHLAHRNLQTRNEPGRNADGPEIATAKKTRRGHLRHRGNPHRTRQARFAFGCRKKVSTALSCAAWATIQFKLGHPSSF
jgi:hypothetical protein